MKLDFCAACGSTEDLHQHHIKPVVISDEKRNTINYDDQITLCYYHHSMIHEITRDKKINHKVLTKEGLLKAKRKGIKLGRRSKTNDDQKRDIIEKLILGASVSSLSREYNISRATIISIRETWEPKKERVCYNRETHSWEKVVFSVGAP